MDLTPYLRRNLDDEIVVVTWFPDPPHIPGHYSVRHRPADEEDLLTYEFLIPEPEIEDNDPYFE